MTKAIETLTDAEQFAMRGGIGAAAVANSRRPIIATAGDSMAGFLISTDMSSGALHYALMTVAQKDFMVDARAGAIDGSGGYNFGLGGSPASYLNADHSGNPSAISLLRAKAVKPDIVFVQTIQNNSMTFAGLTEVDAAYSEVVKFTNACLAEGVSLVVICPRPPYNGQASSTVPRNHWHINQRLQAFADATPGVAFLNYLPDVKAISDANENNGASSVVAWRGAASAGGFTTDGVHFGPLAVRAMAPHIANVLAPFGKVVRPRTSAFGAYDGVTYIYNNLFGRNGLMVGTSGQYNGSTNAGVAGNSTANTRDRWTLTDQNGVVATPSIIVHADGYNRQRLTLCGTASATANFVLQLDFTTNLSVADFVAEAMLDFTNVVGLNSWSLQFNAISAFGQNVSGVASLSDKLFLRSLRNTSFSNSGSSNKQVSLSLNFASGATPSGTVDLGRVGAFRVS